MRRSLAVPAAVLCLCAATTACGPDRPPEVAASEHGRWEVLAATRDGRPTATLDAAYFAFDTATQRMTTNLLSEAVAMGYRREAGHIVTDGPADLQAFELRELSDSTLVLGAVIRGADFEFELRPGVESEEL